MNKNKKNREKCKYCPHFMDDLTDKHCFCALSPNMHIDKYTRRPDWCRKVDVEEIGATIKDVLKQEEQIKEEFAKSVIGPISVAEDEN